ncbi:hypothetical protein FB451DRAFT_1400342 [Mycena latifolia]|nr:hypothetical protein FB451DRAFT_1400342 [Mycena latifolia]
MPRAARPAATPVIPPPFDWSKRRDYTWFSASGMKRMREELAPLLDFELNTFQVECPGRILDGQDVLCIIATGAWRQRSSTYLSCATWYAFYIRASPCLKIFSQVASMQKKNITSLAFNSDTLTAAALASPKRDLWAEAKSGACRLILIGPEMMKSPEYQSFIANKSVRARLGQFTVDELHAADEWGADFRKEFQDITSMRARLPEHTTFVGLSASIEAGYCEWRNVAMFVRPIKYATSGLEFRDVDWLVPPDVQKPSDVPERLLFMQSIDGGHRLAEYLRSLLPPHLRKDGRRLIRHHHSMACPDCKGGGMDSLYKCGEERDCMIHISTDVLTVGVDIPGLIDLVIIAHIASLSLMVQRAGRAVRERWLSGRAYIYVTKADMADALEYLNSDAGKQDTRILEAKDPTSHVRAVEAPDATTVAETAAAPAQENVASGPAVPAATNEAPVTAAVTETGNPATNVTPSTTQKTKRASTKKAAGETPGTIAPPGKRTCISLLLVFAAHARDRCITHQINIICGNPGVDKDCERCSSCVGDTVPEPREIAGSHVDEPTGDVLDPDVEKTPAYMKPTAKDLKAVGEKLEKAADSDRSDGVSPGVPTHFFAITTDFLLLTSEDIFRLRHRHWKYAEESGSALWDVVKALVDDLRRDLVARHEDVLEKQRGARVHKYIVAHGLAGITSIRLKVPEPAALVKAQVDAVVEAADDITAEVPPDDFYGGSPKKGKTNPSKRRAEQSESSERPQKRCKTLEKENLDPAGNAARAPQRQTKVRTSPSSPGVSSGASYSSTSDSDADSRNHSLALVSDACFALMPCA